MLKKKKMGGGGDRDGNLQFKKIEAFIKNIYHKKWF